MSQRAKVSAVVCLAAFMAGLDLFIVNLAFPRIGREFQGTSFATATGTAIVSTTRQIGMALGVAALVAVFAMTGTGVSMTAVRHGWTLVLVASAASALVALAIGRPAHAPVPAAAAEAKA